MRKKIQDLAYARFQYEKPVPQFSAERLEFEVLQEEIYRGSFSLTSVNGIPMRGIIYSSNPRMECLVPEFEGTEVTIRFEFHSEGLVEGDVQKGDFTIIFNGGEYSLSFVASVTRFYTTSSVGKIRNLFDFANLAQVSFEEAYRIFQAPFFLDILKETTEKERLLYRAVGAGRASMQGMEEFLIGIRKKERVTFSIEDTKRQLTEVAEDVQETVKIKKDRWGYLEISLVSDCDWLVPVKSRLTTADFVGNYANAEFVIKKDALHRGNNFGRLTLTSLSQSEVCEICVRQTGRDTAAVQDRDEKKKLLARLTSLYLDFRMQRIVTGVWSKESCVCMERLKELEPDNLWYLLYHAQALLVNKQRQEAEWLLDDFRRLEVKKDSPVYAYYLYLCTLQEKETSYVTKVFAQIREIYHRNQEDIRLFFMMLFLDPDLNQSRSRKLAAIEEKAAAGMNSPVLYMEAYYLIRHDVYLLQKADPFMRQVLYWAVKEKALTPEVAEQAGKCMVQMRQFHPIWYEILKACYLVNPTAELLQAVCSFCIKWNLMGQEQFEWFDKGIREEFRIAGLFEAWMESAPPERLEQLPRQLMIYFQYRNNLNFRKQAMLYAGIVKNKASQKSLYGAYQKNMEHFAVEQMLAGRIDENLAVIYQELLANYIINEETALALSKILYTHRLVCRDKRAARVVVVWHEWKDEQVYPLVNQQAYLPLYSEDYYIIAEDEQGMRYLPEGGFEQEQLMRPEAYVNSCMISAGRELSNLIYYFHGRKTYHTFQKEDMPRLLVLMESDQISQEYKNEIKPQMIEYYYNSYTGEELDAYLRQVDYSNLSRNVRNKLMELMISRGIYEKAYEMLTIFGSEQASVSKLMIVASQKILERDFAEDAYLIGLCEIVFRRGKYNEIILQYLCQYYKGSIRELEKLWKAAKEFEIDTYQLEEHFLVQLLYTEGYTEEMERIFQSYFDGDGQEMILLAYLSWFSYQYFVKDVVMSEALFQCVERQIFLGNPLNDSCRLAYFKWLTEKKERSPGQEQQMESLLEEYLKRQMYFAFYQNLPYRLLRKYHLYDRIFVEYRTNPASRVVISYCLNGPGEENEYLKEELEQMYEGIFVKSFVVFFGEEIPYYMTEEGSGGENITESGHIETHELVSQGDESCYDLINGMMVSFFLKDGQTLRQLHDQYQEKKRQSEEHFWLL